MDATGRLKVLVVDDAVLPRGLICRWLEEDAGAEVQSAANGKIALDKLKTFDADVVTLDLEMPVLSGYEAIPLIRSSNPSAQIIVVSGVSGRAGSLTFDALQRGAADFIAKQGRDNRTDFRREIVSKVRALGRPGPQAPTVRTVNKPAVLKPATAPDLESRRGVLAIGSSTGGPEAVARLLEGLHGDLKVPVLISQHLPKKFSQVFANNLSRKTGFDCVEATDGEPVVKGKVYIAPGDRHMLVRQDGTTVRIVVSDTPPELHCRPAVNPMFRSVATVYGRRALALVLTGMGTDGADGGVTITNAGGLLAVQDQKSSIVWGMPGATVATGATSLVHTIPELSDLVMRVCR